MRAYLVHEALYYRLGAVNFVGRDAGSCVVALEGEEISKTHALIALSESGYTLVDFQSTNGLAVNGRRTDRCELRHGDVIDLGPHQLVFLTSPAPDLDGSRIKELLARIDRLQHVLEPISANLDPDRLIAEVLDRLRASLGAIRALVVLSAPGARLDRSPLVITAPPAAGGPAPAPLDLLLEASLGQRAVMHVPDAHAPAGRRPGRYGAALLAPIQRAGVVRGVLQLELPCRPHGDARDELELVSLLAVQLGLALPADAPPGT